MVVQDSNLSYVGRWVNKMVSLSPAWVTETLLQEKKD